MRRAIASSFFIAVIPSKARNGRIESGAMTCVEEIDRLRELTWGANDDMHEPFSLREAAANRAATLHYASTKPRTVDSHSKNLRRKLEHAAEERDPIRSIYGVGYQLEIE